MKENGIVIVDDSPFTVEMIRNIVEDHGFNVLGTAGSLDEVKKIVRETNPSLVTMDMTLPGTDGLECTRAIHKINENIKVIMVSSMMDDELVANARKNNIAEYVQKPIDAIELITAMKRVLNSDELYTFLKTEYFTAFKASLLNSISIMTQTSVSFQEDFTQDTEFKSKDVSIIVGITGKFPGRMLIDLSKETAGLLAHGILNRKYKNHEEVGAVLEELANIVSGNACSILNQKKKSLGLRISPPSILHGDEVIISPPKFSAIATLANTEFGEIYLNVGFKRGDENWM